MREVGLDEPGEPRRIEMVLAGDAEQRLGDGRERRRDDGRRRATQRIGLVHPRFERVVLDREIGHAVVAEGPTERGLEPRTRFGAARHDDDAAHMPLGEEQLGDGRQRLGHVLADQPHGLAFHAPHPLGLCATEQLALGDGALLLQTARGLEGLAGDGAVGHEEHRRQRDIGLGRHAMQMQHADDAVTDAVGLLGDARRIHERLRRLGQVLRPALGAVALRRVGQQAAVAQPGDEPHGHGAGQHEMQRRVRRLLLGVGLALDARAHLAQRRGHALCGEQADVVRGQRGKRLVDRDAGRERAQQRAVDLVQALVLEDQLGAAVEEPGLAVLALEALALDGSGRDGVDLDLGAHEAREVLDQRTLPRLRHRIVRAVRIRHGDVLLAAEVGADIEDVARPLPLHERHDLLDERVVRGEVGVQRVAPVLGQDVHRHLLGAGDAGVVDEVVDAAEGLERRGDRLRQRRLVGDVDVGEQAHALLGAVVADLLELAHDLVAQLLERPFTARREHHARTGDREQPGELAADAGGTARHQHALAEMQAHQGFDPAEVGSRRTGGVDQSRRHIQVDLRYAALGEQQPRALVGREREAVVLLVAPAYDLVRPGGHRTDAGAPLHFALVAPHADQLLETGAQDVGVDIAGAVGAVRHVDDAQPGIRLRALAPQPRQRARDRERTGELGTEESVDI